MTRDAVTPGEYPIDVLRVACAKCGRAGRYPRERIIARFGRNAAMPDILRELADCSRWSGASDPCGAHFPDLAGTDAGVKVDAEAYMDRHADTFRRLGRT